MVDLLHMSNAQGIEKKTVIIHNENQCRKFELLPLKSIWRTNSRTNFSRPPERAPGPHDGGAPTERLHPGRAGDPQAVRRAGAIQANGRGHNDAAHPHAQAARDRDLA